MAKVREPGDNDDFLYFTQRSIYARGDKRSKNWGATEHKAKVWVFKDEPEIANVDYSCPYCKNKGSKQSPWKRPFSFTCDECERTIKVAKLK